MECPVRFYGSDVDGRRRDLIYLAFGKDQRSGGHAGGFERHVEEAPVRCDGSAESVGASVYAGEEQRALVGFRRCSSGSGVSGADGFGRDAGFASNGRVSVSFPGAGSGSVAGFGGLLDGFSSRVARRYREDQGFVPAFIDGTDIEVDGKCFEGAKCGYRGVLRYQMYSVFVVNLMVSLGLNGGDCHATHGWRYQLDAGALLLLSGESTVWVLADNAYYKSEFAEYCYACHY